MVTQLDVLQARSCLTVSGGTSGLCCGEETRQLRRVQGR